MSPASTATYPTRWWSSARLLITVGITLTTAIALAGVLAVAAQLLTRSTQRDVNAHIESETSQFATFVRSGTLPSTGGPSPTVDALLRDYLSQKYPSEGTLLVATVGGGGPQLVLSKDETAADPTFPADVRDRLLAIGRDPTAPPSGSVGDDARWGKVTVRSPEGESSLVAAVGSDHFRESTSSLMRQLTLASLLGVLLTSVMAWLLAGRLLAPVRRVREAADTVSAADLSRRVPAGGPDEIAALAHTVNAMLDRVEQAHRTQREFLDDAGHELRTPLTVVQGYLDLLPEDLGDWDGTVRIVQDEIQRMTRIVEDLLTLARSTRTDFLRLAPVNLADLALDVELKTEVTAERDWMVRPDADVVAVVDRHRITQALLQFCSNAVRFTRAGDRIEIGCTLLEPGRTGGPAPADGSLPDAEIDTASPVADRRRILWWVHDSGQGIPAGQERAIFERFHTARGQLRDGRGGTGLGLAIVASIAHGHGGRAFAYNAAAGGACFCMVIPFVPPPPAPPGSGVAGDPEVPDRAILADGGGTT